MFYRFGLVLIVILAAAQTRPMLPVNAESLTPPMTAEAAPDAETPLLPTATLGGVALQFVSGVAGYQNRQPDHSGIEVQALDEHLSLIGAARTDSRGVYAVATPVEAFYWLVIDAPLHRQQVIPMQPGERIPDVILAGGDFNNDGCIGPADLAALMDGLDMPGSSATDITGDGITDVADLAIVTGNYQPGCERASVETPVPEMTPEAESTAEATPEIEQTAEVTPEWMPDVEPTSEITPNSELTPEVTSEATAELVTELEITPEVTAEVTAELTEEPPAELPVPTPTERPVPTQSPVPTATLTLTAAPTWTPAPTETPLEFVQEETEESSP
jgi:hypothetical protein